MNGSVFIGGKQNIKQQLNKYTVFAVQIQKISVVEYLSHVGGIDVALDLLR